MTKQEFIEKLKKELKNESYETVCQSITYYEEMIDDLVEDGIEESEAVSRLGSMQEILANINGQEVIEIKKMKKSTSISVSILLILGFPLWGSLLAAAACLILSFYILLWCVPIVTVAFGISGFIAFVIGIFGSMILFTESISLALTQLGVSALMGAMSIIGIYLTYIVYGRIMKITKNVNENVKQWLIDVFRKVGAIC
ncbi:MAG: DUF1700 domain-containing protein [Coprobacillus sp.]